MTTPVSLGGVRTKSFRATLLGLLIASTWWLRNASTAIRFVLSSRKVVAHSLGPPWEIHTFIRWCEAFARCVTGYGVLAIIVLIVAVTQWRTIALRHMIEFADIDPPKGTKKRSA